METTSNAISSPTEVLVVAIAGPTAAGKSTLVESLKQRYASTTPVFHLSQDDFYIDNELIETTGKWKNWDIPSSFNLVDLAAAVKAAEEKARAARPVGLVLVDGIVLFSHPDLVQQFNAIIALDIPEAHFKERRFNRDTWIQENGEYFEDVVLPAHYEHGIIPSLDHGRTFRVDALQSMDQVHQSVFEQLEAWRGSKS